MNALVQFQPPRLPYHPALEERFGVDKSSWKALVEAIFPAAESIDSVVMALAYCKARNLDPFKRPVHIVPVYDSKRRCMVETVWPGIAELRTTAMRTSHYGGCDETAFGPEITTKLSGVEMTFPEWAQCTVYRLAGGVRYAVVGPKTYWRETYATAKRDSEAPNSMWRKRPRGQLEKCAEAGALRKAFPEELGGEYAAEEMEGRTIGPDGAPLTVIEPSRPRVLHAGFDVPDAPVEPEPAEAQAEPAAETIADAEIEDLPLKTGAELLAEKVAEREAEASGEAEAPADDFTLTPNDFDHEDWATYCRDQIDNAASEAALKSWWNTADTQADFEKLKAVAPSLGHALFNHVVETGRKLAGARKDGNP